METVTFLLAVIASLTQIWGHVAYNKNSAIHPNLTSWTIWGVTSAIDTWNYSEMTGDWQKNILSFTCSAMCLVTWIVCIYKGRFEKLQLEQVIGFVACITAIVLWKRFGFIRESNVVLQVDNLISFIPIIAGVVRNPKEERPQPWLWWTLSYGLGTAVVLLRYRQWQDLLYPLGCAVLHAAVAILSMRSSRTPNTIQPLPE